MEKKLKLIIHNVKIYGCVFIIDDEPYLFMLDNNDKITDKIPIYNDFEDDDDELYLLLDEDEMILVGVEILDTDFEKVNIDDLNENNYEDFIYNLTPLKIKTIDNKNINMEYLLEHNLLEKYLNDVVDDYKNALQLTIDDINNSLKKS